jgi:DNA-binding NarL/FixJ family response regulator
LVAPKPVPTHQTLSQQATGWTTSPKSNLQIVVRDLRAERSNSIELISAIQSQISNALAGMPTAHSHYMLTVDVIEHRSFFTLGNWNGTQSKMSTTVKNSKMARRYGEEFKRQAVELLIHSGKSQRQVARELDVSIEKRSDGAPTRSGALLPFRSGQPV